MPEGHTGEWTYISTHSQPFGTRQTQEVSFIPPAFYISSSPHPPTSHCAVTIYVYVLIHSNYMLFLMLFKSFHSKYTIKKTILQN